MGCISGKKENPYILKGTKTTKFTPLELELLSLMYDNLAKRCRNSILSRETFDVFFHASGLIGEILFLKFDASKTGAINFQNFLQAFQIMLKGTVRERADVLFELYDIEKTGGVTYSQLLKILFSYPIEQLNKMLIEEPFLKYIGEGQLSYYFGAEHKKIEERNIIEQQSEQSEKEGRLRRGSMYAPTSTEFIEIQTDFRQEIQKHRGKMKAKADLPAIKPLALPSIPMPNADRGRKGVSTCITIDQFKKNRKNPRIKSNISSLTKKYANFLFNSYKLDKDKDEFSKQNFYKLIQQHPALFNVYLSGFHTYIWQCDIGEPQYLTLTPWIQNYAREYYQQSEGGVYLKYIKTTVFIFGHIKSKIPIDIINCQGLTVDKIDKEGRYGIFFKHRDGLYPSKEYYFESKDIREEWMKQLADFKDSSIFDSYVKLQRIGGGNFSNVFRGKDKKTDKEIAIKVIQNFKLTPSEREVIKRECGILRQCHHPNIIRFLAEYKTKTHFYIVTEILSEGDLFEYTKKNGFLEEYQAAVIFKQLVDTILYVNDELGIIHRDLKPENVMIIMNDEKKMIKKIKLIDFGFGVFKDKLNQLPLKEKFAGTPGFIAPEIYKQETYDQKIDTFSLGIILYFMLCGYLPFQSNFIEQIEDMTKNCTYSLVNAHWANVSEEAKELIYKVLTFKEYRITTKEVSQHPWLQNIEQLKQYSGKNRKNKIL